MCDLISTKIALVERLARQNHQGTISKKQFADVLGKHPSTVTGIIQDPTFGDYVKENTPGGKGQVHIPVETAIKYIQRAFRSS